MNSILILGATSDIAIATARQFAKTGEYRFILAGRDMEKIRLLEQDLLIKYNAEVKSFEFDATDYKSHQKFYSSIGTTPTITICAFGYLGDQDISEKDWGESLKVLSINYIGAISILNIIASDYEKHKNGCIIGITSVAGERGRQSNYLYGSAKGGFSVYLEGLRNRLFSTGNHVLSVKPGFVATKMTEGLALPKLLLATPAQVGKAIYDGYRRKKNEIYVLPVWRWIMFIIKQIPEPIFKKLHL